MKLIIIDYFIDKEVDIEGKKVLLRLYEYPSEKRWSGDLHPNAMFPWRDDVSNISFL